MSGPTIVSVRFRAFVAVLALVLLTALGPNGATGAAQGAEILRIRHFSGPEKTRVVLDLSGPASFEIREIGQPDRLAVNLPRCFFANTNGIGVSDGRIKGIRCNPGHSRAQVVLDLAEKAEFHTFSLPSCPGKSYRVVVDVFGPAKTPAQNLGSRTHGVSPQSVANDETERGPEIKTQAGESTKIAPVFTVVIDPGHGGSDPGAVRGRTKEKDIVLAVSLKLAKYLNGIPGYRAVLTRDGDYFFALDRRVAFAAEKQGDLFLSVHCNTNPRKKVKGMEVYFLSLQGATDRESKELADHENAADLVGLDSNREPEDMVMKILMDMRMTRVLDESARLAENLLNTTEDGAVVGKRKVKQAGFQVLKSLAMPSALVELAYLSNPKDLKTLRSSEGRDQLAALLAEGVLSWRNDRPGLALQKSGEPASWGRKYAVRKGDNLWSLASRNGTTVKEISTRNQLQSGRLMVGQILSLPQGVNQP